MKLSGAILFVKDLERMSAFYADTLGLRMIAATRTENWAEFESGLGLHAIPPHIAASIEITVPPQVREDTPIKLVFTVADVQAEHDRLRALGVDVTLRPWGVCEGVDPEGNLFQLNK